MTPEQEFELLKPLLKKAYWSTFNVQWFRDQFVRARRNKKIILLKEGYMGGTAFFAFPKGEEPKMRFRQDIEEKFPGKEQIIFGGYNGEENQDKGSTGRKETDNKECVQSVSKTDKNSGKVRKRGRSRKSKLVFEPA